MRKWQWWLLGCVLLVVLIVVVGGWLWLRPTPAADPLTASAMTYRTTSLKLGGRTFELDIADTSPLHELGLSGRVSLADNRGMLFVFPYADQRCFWMKDMQFSIDIIWADSRQKVNHIEKSLTPATYPQTYCPEPAAQYVVELPAGMVDKVGVKVGDTLPFGL